MNELSAMIHALGGWLHRHNLPTQDARVTITLAAPGVAMLARDLMRQESSGALITINSERIGPDKLLGIEIEFRDEKGLGETQKSRCWAFAMEQATRMATNRWPDPSQHSGETIDNAMRIYRSMTEPG